MPNEVEINSNYVTRYETLGKEALEKRITQSLNINFQSATRSSL